MKKIKRTAKIRFNGGQAKPGATLASLGVNMPQFCNAFNEASKDRKGEIVPADVVVYDDKSFDLYVKTSPTSFLLKKLLKIDKGSGTPNSKNVGEITDEQITSIAKIKFPEMNAKDLIKAKKSIVATAKSLGIIYKEK